MEKLTPNSLFSSSSVPAIDQWSAPAHAIEAVLTHVRTTAAGSRFPRRLGPPQLMATASDSGEMPVEDGIDAG